MDKLIERCVFALASNECQLWQKSMSLSDRFMKLNDFLNYTFEEKQNDFIEVLQKSFYAEKKEIIGQINKITSLFKYYENEAPHYLLGTQKKDKFHSYHIKHIPIGKVLVLAPRNVPIYTSFWGILPSLIAGNITIVKFPEEGKCLADFLNNCAKKHKIPLDFISASPDYATNLIKSKSVDFVIHIGNDSSAKDLESLSNFYSIPFLSESSNHNIAVFEDTFSEDTLIKFWEIWRRHSAQLCVTPHLIAVPFEETDSYIRKINELASRDFTTLPKLSTLKDQHKFLKHLNDTQNYLKTRTNNNNSYAKISILDNLINLPSEVIGPMLYLYPYRDIEELAHQINQISFFTVSVFGNNQLIATSFLNKIKCARKSYNCFSGTQPGVSWAGKPNEIELLTCKIFDHLAPKQIVRKSINEPNSDYSRESESTVLQKNRSKLSRRLQQKFYKLFFGEENKNHNEKFNSWRLNVLKKNEKYVSDEIKNGMLAFSDDLIEKHWVKKSIGSHYRSLITKCRMGFTKTLIEKEIPKNLSLLDVGCASGALVSVLNHTNKVGVDLHPECINKSRNLGIESYQSAAEKLPFSDNNFDWTLILETLEHTRSPFNALSECARVSKNGVIVSVPMFKKSRIISYSTEVFKGDNHLFELTAEDIIILARHAGLEHQVTIELSIEKVFKLNIITKLFSKLVGQKWQKWVFITFKKKPNETN